jgi:hypothetical protein
MAWLICTNVSRGLRPSEVVATVQDLHGQRHFVCEDKESLTTRKGRSYLWVDVVFVDAHTRALLVELPHEAENGAHRIWIEPANLLDAPEVAPCLCRIT